MILQTQFNLNGKHPTFKIQPFTYSQKQYVYIYYTYSKILKEYRGNNVIKGPVMQSLCKENDGSQDEKTHLRTDCFVHSIFELVAFLAVVIGVCSLISLIATRIYFAVLCELSDSLENKRAVYHGSYFNSVLSRKFIFSPTYLNGIAVRSRALISQGCYSKAISCMNRKALQMKSC